MNPSQMNKETIAKMISTINVPDWLNDHRIRGSTINELIIDEHIGLISGIDEDDIDIESIGTLWGPSDFQNQKLKN